MTPATSVRHGNLGVHVLVLGIVLVALAAWVGAYALLERWTALNRWLLDGEYMEALMVDVIRRPPPEAPYLIMLGASPAYFAFPKGAHGYWKFRPDDLPASLRRRYIGAFAGHEDPLFHFPFLRLMQRDTGILRPGSVVVLAVTNFPTVKGEDFAAGAARHFQWWHARYGLYRYRPGGEIEPAYPAALMPAIVHVARAVRLYRALKQRLWAWPGEHGRVLAGEQAARRRESLEDAAGERERKRAEALWRSPEFNEPALREPRPGLEEGLAAMVRYVREHGCTVVFLSMPQGSMRRELFAPFEPSRAFYREFAQRHGAIYLDYSESLRDDQFVKKDYVHASEEGARALRDAVMPRLAELLRQGSR